MPFMSVYIFSDRLLRNPKIVDDNPE